MTLLLTGPNRPMETCATCGGKGAVSFPAARLARICPTCRGAREVMSQPWGMDRRVYELGLEPR